MWFLNWRGKNPKQRIKRKSDLRFENDLEPIEVATALKFSVVQPLNARIIF